MGGKVGEEGRGKSGNGRELGDEGCVLTIFLLSLFRELREIGANCTYY